MGVWGSSSYPPSCVERDYFIELPDGGWNSYEDLGRNVPQNNHERMAGICKEVLIQSSGMASWSYVLSPSALFSPGKRASGGISVSYSDRIYSGQAS